MEFKGLENKLSGDVKAGSLLVLRTNDGDAIAGFVRDVSTRRVVLSHENPNNKIVYATYIFPHVTMGNRSYSLSGFDSYTVIPAEAYTPK